MIADAAAAASDPAFYQGPLGFIVIGLLALFGMPLFIVMFMLAALLFGMAGDKDIVSSFIVMGDILEKSYLLPIPMFTLAGFILAESGAPRRLVRVFDAWFGWLPGGLAVVSIGTLAFFTTFTGASGVTIIALGGLLWPLLAERGYPARFRLGVLTSSGSIGLLFFPSLPVFLFATVYALSGASVELDPGALFLAGLLPGMLLVGVLAGYSMFLGARRKIPRKPFMLAEALASARGAAFELLLPVFLIGLLVSGQIGLPDVSIATVLYVFMVEVVVYRDLKMRDLPKVTADAMALVGAIVVILAVILGLNDYVSDERIPDQIVAWLRESIDNKWVMLLALNGFLLVVGCVMDIFSALLVIVPLLVPLAEQFGINPLHLGVIFLANLEVGYVTPPVGMNLFISALHFRQPILDVARAVVPFMLLMLMSVMIITYVEPLSLALPQAFGMDPMAEVEGAGEDGGDGGVEESPAELLDEGEDLDKYLEAPKGEDKYNYDEIAEDELDLDGLEDDLEGGGDDDLDEYLDDDGGGGLEDGGDDDLDQYLDPPDAGETTP